VATIEKGEMGKREAGKTCGSFGARDGDSTAVIAGRTSVLTIGEGTSFSDNHYRCFSALWRAADGSIFSRFRGLWKTFIIVVFPLQWVSALGPRDML